MGTLSVVWAVLSLFGTLVALIPFLGVLNWLNLPFCLLGIVISAIAVGTSQHKTGAVVALIVCFFMAGISFLRLLLGGGIL